MTSKRKKKVWWDKRQALWGLYSEELVWLEHEWENVCDKIFFSREFSWTPSLVTFSAPVTQVGWSLNHWNTTGVKVPWKIVSVCVLSNDVKTVIVFSKLWGCGSKWIQIFTKWDPNRSQWETAGQWQEGGTGEKGDSAPRNLYHHWDHHRCRDLHLPEGHPKELGQHRNVSSGVDRLWRAVTLWWVVHVLCHMSHVLLNSLHIYTHTGNTYI